GGLAARLDDDIQHEQIALVRVLLEVALDDVRAPQAAAVLAARHPCDLTGQSPHDTALLVDVLQGGRVTAATRRWAGTRPSRQRHRPGHRSAIVTRSAGEGILSLRIPSPALRVTRSPSEGGAPREREPLLPSRPVP